MHYNTLGRSGLKVSALQLGTMTFGGDGAFAKTGSTDLDGAKRQIAMAAEAGVNMLDTSNVYSNGLSEQIIGDAVADHRDAILLATKVRFPMGSGPNDRGLSRHHIISACEASLKRLKTDHIDLYWCHQWDGMTPVEETLRALDDLTRAGKIRYAGVSNFSAWHIMKYLGVSEREGFVRPVAQQIHYTLQAREAEQELLPVAMDQGVGAVIWSPLAGGLLTGKYRRNQPDPEGTRRIQGWTEPPVYDPEALYDIIDVLCEVADSYDGVTPAQVALAWLMGREGVASVIVGARNEQQLADNLKAADLTLEKEAVEKLEKVSRKPLAYPYWHQKATASDRLSPADLSLIEPHLEE
ncbi:Predicted oxidoreductase [Cohaesibacter sp. ES.047]|uniref:aldo/keto reductase n=1 Tax=Cohaesibacter sp. ES.047 TaxID=1798205 RepID=UPI000BB9B08C|nr:aldo/keto reductase [Cohaesibacter sp. ES.047]SNY90211.1 Predicted oxidoreductase [Cohaesibacter sp. ES.047]